MGGYSDLVLVKVIPFYSHCEHPLVPIVGQAHVAYRPSQPQKKIYL
ncbi:GTP cyclohydrolase I [Rhizobium calliandrae]|uniref:GTP cyclohydrolase I n=1 Tax=Rhizobium calliandrae TaxID=1312182 RepID=A0ABT7KCW6_9HYPH|nr:GTP cyclohydrolase I [Rhizobium calliandrae]MDL2405828.1 GTP cyclohydrolase I [Rhizobium calliandrae]